jgi:hypothetical protein
MRADPIVADVSKTRAEIAAGHGNDIARLVAHFRQQQAGRNDLVSRSPRPVARWMRTEQAAPPS